MTAVEFLYLKEINNGNADDKQKNCLASRFVFSFISVIKFSVQGQAQLKSLENKNYTVNTMACPHTGL